MPSKKVAAIQMCSSDNVEKNLETACRLISDVVKNNAHLIVLPEMFAMMGKKTIDKVNNAEEYGSGKIQQFLSAQAKQHGVWIVGGTIPIFSVNKNKIKAACLVYNSSGEVAARYDKIHLFDAQISETECYRESDTTDPGDKVVVIDTPVGKLGLAVCYDIRFSALFLQLAKKGAEIIAIPAAFTVKTGEAHWQLLARARAVENFCYVIGACQGGEHASGRKTYGHSLIVDSWGTVLQEAGDSGNTIIDATIDLKKLHDIRASFGNINSSHQ